MSCTILRTDTFNDQLQDALIYIAEDSGDTDIALDYLDRVEKAILRLRDFPESGTLPRYASLRRRGFRALIVERHLVFYKLRREQNAVLLYAFLDGRQEYKNLI